MILLQRFSCQIQQHRKPRFAQCIHKRVEVKKFFAHAQTKVSLAVRDWIKGPLKYLVAKLHRCYPGEISLPVSQNFFARFLRRRPVADSSRCLTFSLRCNKHKKHFLLTFLLINGLLYGYNMCVVPLFFIL